MKRIIILLAVGVVLIVAVAVWATSFDAGDPVAEVKKGCTGVKISIIETKCVKSEAEPLDPSLTYYDASALVKNEGSVSTLGFYIGIRNESGSEYGTDYGEIVNLASPQWVGPYDASNKSKNIVLTPSILGGNLCMAARVEAPVHCGK
jgi:hypothetical protein